MSDIDRLFDEYREAYAGGGDADPDPYLSQVEGAERAELEALIEGYLMRGPGRPWDAEAFAGSRAEALTDAVERSWRGKAGWWPELLPRLRKRAELTRPKLAERLAEALGAGAKREKVERYYGEMEQGSLPAAGVSAKVLEALAGILGESTERIREAGAALTAVPKPPASPDTAFARMAQPDPEYLETQDLSRGGMPSPADSPRRADDPKPEWDEVDELFRGARG